jgi:hypothetical protein
MEESEVYHLNRIVLGPIGQPEAGELNAAIESYIPFLYESLANGKILPSEYSIPSTSQTGIDSVPEVLAYQAAGKGGNVKVVVEMVTPDSYENNELLKEFPPTK